MEERHDLAKWLAGEMSPEELRAFEASPDFGLYQKIAATSSKLSAPAFDEESRLQQIYETPKVIPMQRRSNRTLWYSIAAVLVVACGLLWFIGNNDSGMTQAVADAGNQRNLTLPDASEVTLNSGSALAFNGNHWDDSRQVNLQGEAFFHVAKGKRFDVKTALGTVSVLGTQFNVRERGDQLDVACFEGRVRVAAFGNETILLPGDAISFAGGKPTTYKVEANGRPTWLDGKLAFRSQKLSDILAELSRVYDIDMEDRTGKSDEIFSGTLPSKNLENALEILCKAYDLKARTVQNKVVLSGNE